MAYDFSNLKKRKGEIEEWLGREFSGLRTGRATPAILDSIFVESYGSRQPIKHIAAISVEDAKTIMIKPWDQSLTQAIEGAISSSGLGINPSTSNDGIRISFPELTSERREMLNKIIKTNLEEARISLKKERDEVWSKIQKDEKEGEISEDDKFRLKDELQKIIDEGNKALEDMVSKKELEIKG
ncbi:MAG: ribosome recycling factor [Parcubacteria group bacterium CG10_big_fil_rev_8_21_14_0_10_38_31]|nr:MAG: ribosome recycling factor [Parcubacteria group bacterium CG10_big_fil_rev_8_21_14_0_10_38_31]